MALLHARGISKAFDGHVALHGIDLDVNESEILALLGPSGCGKTTLLRIIAGLETPDAGEILFAGTDMNRVPAHRRHFGLMFQDYALFPHLNVRENIAYGLTLQRLGKREIDKRVDALLELVNLAGFAERAVTELSGGERQRVALARSLAPSPRLLMLDEPLAALDRALRDHLGLEIRNIIKKVGIPAILVTHDQSEAFAMADRVAVLERGRILQCDTPAALYARPVNAAVASFIGLGNVIREGELHAILCARTGQRGTFLIRPDAACAEGGICLDSRVCENVFRGQHYQTRVEILGTELVFRLDSPLPAGNRLTICLDEAKIQTIES
jgi:ABC-type Fe3+/spermidine/putrescine transport system ATPase subunit